MKTRSILVGLIFLIVVTSFALADTCYTSVANVPVVCTGGSITQDMLSGSCRTILCSSNNDSLQVQACDKPTSISPDHFEVYKQNQIGSSVSSICLGTACISNNGFASQNFPVCSGNVVPPVINNTNQVTAVLSVAPWYPQGNNYVLICNANGFIPTSYDFTFGDGQQLSSYNQNNIYHTYNNGIYDATCIAKSSTQQGIGTLHINVGTSVPPINTTGNQTNQTNPTNNSGACFSSVQYLPASCTGIITQDINGGTCRTILCSNNVGSVNVQACEKTDTAGKFFEMYRQSSTNTPPQVCLGNDCLKSGWGYQTGSHFPICINTTTPPQNNTNQTSTDPGATSSLNLVSGLVNGQSLSSTEREIVVSPGQQISGNINVAYTSTYSNAVMAFGATSNWGDHASSYVTYSSLSTPSTGTVGVPINFVAPTTPGTYYVIVADRAELNTAQVFSMTNWAYGSPVWNDGNDIASWTQGQINDSINNGRVLGSVLTTNNYQPYYVPATAIMITVKGYYDGATSTLTIGSGNINGQTISSASSSVTVSPGQQITGSLILNYYSSWNSNAVIALGGTPNWGDHATSYQDYGYLSTPSTGSKTVNVASTAPTTPGTYYLIYSFNGQFNAAQTMSMTSWATGNGNPVWNDGNDVASWSQYQIDDAIVNGRTWGTILYNNGFQKWIVPATALKIIVSGSLVPANDPGATSSLGVQSGSINGQTLSSSIKKISVVPGQTISGNVQFTYTSTFGSNAVMQVASTTNWGDHASNCADQGSLTTPATGTISTNINTTAPTTPGKYYIVFAYSGEFNKDQICSMTSWSRSGGVVYNDGNDLADWNASQILQSQTSGRATSYRMYNDGYHYVYTPSDVIEVDVTSTNTAPLSCYQNVVSQTPNCINSQLTSTQQVDGCTQYICSSNTGSITVKACDKPSSSFHPYYFEMYKTTSTGYGPDFCLGTTCFANSGYAQSKISNACVLTPDARGWTSYLSGWSYNNGIYYASNTQPDVPVESYYPEGFGWTDYNVSVSMNTQSSYAPADSQLIMRYQSSLNYVACRIMQDYNGTRLEIVDPQHNVLNSIPYQFNVGQWYTLQAGIHGNSVTCQVANHPETLLKATYTLTNSGTVGLRGTHIPVQYQNMTITFG